ncbi:MAG TPA: KGG domain-containing protein [Candidatus Saccharimonadales bacterium]|nr:KGG domain-containing protein [Candidatus Saccharimonadales bacterium]
MATSGKSRRGFAAMDPKRQREIAARGGRASRGGGKRKRTTTE